MPAACLHCCLFDSWLTIALDQPRPAAELGHCSIRECSPELIITAKGSSNGFGQGARRLPAAAWGHAVPVKGMVPDLRGD